MNSKISQKSYEDEFEGFNYLESKTFSELKYFEKEAMSTNSTKQRRLSQKSILQKKLTAPSPVIKFDSTLTFSSVRFLFSVFAMAAAILSSKPVFTNESSRT